MSDPRRYDLSEIVSGIFVVCCFLFMLQSVLDVFVLGVHYNNYCCCNLEKVENEFVFPGNEINTYSENSFCLYYNTTRHSTNLYWNSGELLKNMINLFKNQTGMNNDEFMWFLYLKNIPLYVIPNIHCSNMLNKLNLNKNTIGYNCIDINIKA